MEVGMKTQEQGGCNLFSEHLGFKPNQEQTTTNKQERTLWGLNTFS